MEPDRRHRCFAEVKPEAPALAHQGSYCLAAAFPACPIFQSWAVRAAAEGIRPAGGVATEPAVGAAAIVGGVPPESLPEAQTPRRGGHTTGAPARSWAAPPPWAAEPPPQAPLPQDLIVNRAAGRRLDAPLADEPPAAWIGPASVRASMVAEGDAEAELPDFLARAGSPAGAQDTSEYRPPPSQARPTARASGRGGMSDGDAPEWRKPRRFEAYPTIRTRAGNARIPRLALAALGLLAVALLAFALPGLLAPGDSRTRPRGAGVASGSTAAAPTPTRRPTPVPAPTPEIYIVASGDTLGRIANEHGFTVEELLAANPQLEDPDRIAVGDEIIIPDPDAPSVSRAAAPETPAASP